MDDEQAVYEVNFKGVQDVEFHNIKGTLSSLRKFLEIENSLLNDEKYFSP